MNNVDVCVYGNWFLCGSGGVGATDANTTHLTQTERRSFELLYFPFAGRGVAQLFLPVSFLLSRRGVANMM